jgi:TolB-like protein
MTVVAAQPHVRPQLSRVLVWMASAIVVSAVGSRVTRQSPREPPINPLSIAVLPFVNLNSGTDAEALADGLTDELTHTLATIQGLQVVGRTSAFQFKNQLRGLRLIGRQLGVAAVVEGSVRQADGALAITAQLIDTKTGYHDSPNGTSAR